MNTFAAAALDAELERTAQRQLDVLAIKRRASGRTDDLRNYSLARLIHNLADERRHGFFEAEISADLERKQPAEHGGLLLPWGPIALSTRALIAGSSSAGGFAVDTENLTAQDALRPATASIELGATVIALPFRGNASIPTQTGVATASWQTTETTQTSETQQTFGQLALAPHTVTSYSEVSRLSLRQSAPTPIDDVVTRDLIAVNGRALDLAVMTGAGTSGAPHGIVGATNVQTFSGTSLSLTGLINATTALGDALDYSGGVACNRTTAGLLRTRQEASGSTRMLWEGSLLNGLVTGLPARSTTALPSGMLILGAWRRAVIAVWGNIEVAANPYAVSNFSSGIVGVRAFLTCDTGVTYPGAFNVAAAVS
jgi:HK97 family phage major capsid protein